MNIQTMYTCQGCGVLIAKLYGATRLLYHGSPGFPEEAKSWERFLNCPVCKKPEKYEEIEIGVDTTSDY